MATCAAVVEIFGPIVPYFWAFFCGVALTALWVWWLR